MKTITRLYEIIACLLILACLAQMLGGAPSYDARLSELQQIMQQDCQQRQKQVVVRLDSIRAEVRKSGNTQVGLECINRAQMLIKRTTEINHLLQQKLTPLSTRNDRIATLRKAIKKHKEWLRREFKDLDIDPIDPEQRGYLDTDKVTITARQLHLLSVQAMILNKLDPREFTFRNERRVHVVSKFVENQLGEEYTADVLFGEPTSFQQMFFRNNDQLTDRWSERGEVAFKTSTIGKQYWRAKFRFFLQGKNTTVVRKIYYEVK